MVYKWFKHEQCPPGGLCDMADDMAKMMMLDQVDLLLHSTCMGWIWVTEPGLLAISADGVVVVCAVGGEIVSRRQSAC